MCKQEQDSRLVDPPKITVYKTLQKTYRTNHVDVPQLIKSRKKKDGEPNEDRTPKTRENRWMQQELKKWKIKLGQTEAGGYTIQARTKTTLSRSKMPPTIQNQKLVP
jgi:hypothetical protein